MDEWASVPLSVHHRSRVFGQSLQLLHLVHQSLEAHPLHPAKTTLASTWQEPLKRVNVEKHNLPQKNVTLNLELRKLALTPRISALADVSQSPPAP